jgi:CspA family cold shock protein
MLGIERSQQLTPAPKAGAVSFRPLADSKQATVSKPEFNGIGGSRALHQNCVGSFPARPPWTAAPASPRHWGRFFDVPGTSRADLSFANCGSYRTSRPRIDTPNCNGLSLFPSSWGRFFASRRSSMRARTTDFARRFTPAGCSCALFRRLIRLPPLFQTGEADVAIGTVKWFNATKGYGFIQPDSGGKDVFVHISAVEKAGFTGLAEGAKVSYEVVSDRGKESAGNLRIG